MPPPNCDPTAEVIEKIEAAVRNLIGDKADKFMEVLKKDEDASFEDAIKAAGVEPKETGRILKLVHHIYSQGWECPKMKKEGKSHGMVSYCHVSSFFFIIYQESNVETDILRTVLTQKDFD